MTIVEAGARHDLGETASALRTLENAPLRSASREDWVVRLRYAYADLLPQAGRTRRRHRMVPPHRRHRRRRTPPTPPNASSS